MTGQSLRCFFGRHEPLQEWWDGLVPVWRCRHCLLRWMRLWPRSEANG